MLPTIPLLAVPATPGYTLDRVPPSALGALGAPQGFQLLAFINFWCRHYKSLRLHFLPYAAETVAIKVRYKLRQNDEV